MATPIENLETRRAAICTELAALTSSAAGGLPNASGDGGGIDHVGYKDGLYRELEQIEKAIGALSAHQDGAFEVTSEARG